MSDPRKDVEVPCGQENQVGGDRMEAVTLGAGLGTPCGRGERRRGEVDTGADGQMLGGRSLGDDCNAVAIRNIA